MPLISSANYQSFLLSCLMLTLVVSYFKLKLRIIKLFPSILENLACLCWPFNQLCVFVYIHYKSISLERVTPIFQARVNYSQSLHSWRRCCETFIELTLSLSGHGPSLTSVCFYTQRTGHYRCRGINQYSTNCVHIISRIKTAKYGCYI